MPCRRVAEGVLDQGAADLEDPLLVAEARGAAVDAVPRQLVPRPLGVRAELLEQELRDLGEVDRIAVDTEAAGVEAGEVEQLTGELRQTIDLLAHASEELAPGRVVELLLDEQLEMAAEREKRRPELVRGVGDELAPGVLEAREALAHAVERTRELAELVRARVHDRLVELAVRDPFGRALEATNPAREKPCAGIAEQQRGRQSASRAEMNRRCLTSSTLPRESSIEFETRKTYFPSVEGWAASANRRSPNVTTPRAE